MSRFWRACFVGSLLVLMPSAALAADWPDGRTTYRVLNGTGNETLSLVCKDDLCEIEPFQIAVNGQDTPVTVTAPLTLGADRTASAEVAIDESCGRDTGTLTVTAAPGSDLEGTVEFVEVNTQSCFAPAGAFGFVAEVVSAPAVPLPVPQGSPSVLSNLRTLDDVTVTEVGLAGAGAVILVAAITWPTSLLNSAAAAAAERLGRWRRNRWAALGRANQDRGPDRGRRWWWAGSGVLAAGAISIFVDPGVGLDETTLRLLASVLTAFSIEVFLGWALVILLMKRWVPGAVPSFVFHPASMFVVVGAVAFSRLTSFQPGIVFGLVAGITFVALETRRERALEALVPLGFTFVVAMIAWTTYSLLGKQAGGLGLFASEALAAAVAAGVTALPLVLLPIRGLPGRSVFEWNRWIWMAGYTLALMSFFVVLMPMPTAWSAVDASLAAWLGGYVAYLSVACFAWFAMRERNQSNRVQSPPAA